MAVRVSSRAWWTTILYIAAVAMFLRFYELPLRPMHHDEGVNALILSDLVRPPHIYRYDPANYHGPTIYYLGWLSTAAFGLTTIAVRFVTALAGLATVLAVLLLWRQVGPIGALSAAALLAVSPGAVYFSRYFIHEALLVCFTSLTVVAGSVWWHRGKTMALCLTAVSAGLMFATKETALLSAVVWIGALVGTALLLKARGLALTGAPAELVRPPPVTALSARRTLLRLALVVGLFGAVNFLFYTSFFTYWRGGIDAVTTFAIWTRTGVTAHVHPWHAYIDWLWTEELPLLLLGSAGAAVALWRVGNSFAVFTALWAGGVLVAYSAIPYKTPWLTLNVIAPLAISGGYACEQIWRCRNRMWRRGMLAAAGAVVGIATFQTVVLNFVEYDNERHSYVYAHTSREVLTLVEEIRAIEAQNPNTTVAVTSGDHFPLSWYLREFPVGYYGDPVVTGDPLVIASVEQADTLGRSLGTRYERVGLYQLRPGVRLVLFARQDLLHGGSQ
jgi:uncharacterized protein (TIGR03663 family)